MKRGTSNIEHGMKEPQRTERTERTTNIESRTSNEREPSPHPDPLPSHQMGAEREQQVAGESGSADWQLMSGSWSQCMRKIERRLSMNRNKSETPYVVSYFFNRLLAAHGFV